MFIIKAKQTLYIFKTLTSIKSGEQKQPIVSTSNAITLAPF